MKLFVVILSTIFFLATPSFACRVSFNVDQNQEAPLSKRVCLQDGESRIVAFDKNPIFESVVAFAESDGSEDCRQVDVTVDSDNRGFMLGPKLQTGCYIVFYRQAR